MSWMPPYYTVEALEQTPLMGTAKNGASQRVALVGKR
jgi:hypothetical protein